MSWIADVVTTALSGGVTGVLGVALSGFFTWKEKANERAHELALGEQDLKERRLEGELLHKQIEIEANAQVRQAEAQAFAESFNADQARYSIGDTSGANKALIFVDVVRGLIRPCLTLYLVVILTVLAYQLITALGGLNEVLSTMDGQSLLTDIVQAMVYLTVTAVTWWFGTRHLPSKK